MDVTEQAPLELPPQRFKLRIEDYLLLDDAGAFEGIGRTELIDGEIVLMPPQHRPHVRIKSRLHVLLSLTLAEMTDDLESFVEPSVAVPPHNVPAPDIVITSAADGEGLVPLDSVRLAIEVSDSSPATDLGRKLAIYARAGIAEYWVIDVRANLIHQHWAPDGEGYTELRQVALGERIEAVTIGGLAVETVAL